MTNERLTEEELDSLRTVLCIVNDVREQGEFGEGSLAYESMSLLWKYYHRNNK